jgi:hypothetical protein
VGREQKKSGLELNPGVAQVFSVINQLSGLSLNELGSLRATLHTIFLNERFLCVKCVKKTNHEQEATALGCENPLPVGVKFLGSLDSGLCFKFRRCPGNYFLPHAHRFIAMHDAFEMGILPYPGGFGDQPSKMIEVFREIGEYKRRLKDKLQRQATKKSRGLRG